MKKAVLSILLAIQAIVAVGAGWGLLHAASLPAAAQQLRWRVTAAEARALQTQADTACRCSRDAGDNSNSDCWEEFNRSLAPFEHYSMASACMAGSVAMECIGRSDGSTMDSGRDTCIFTERPYASCSAEEASTRQAEARARRQSGC